MPTVAEIAARLSADNSQYRSVMGESENVAARTGQGILKKLDLRAATSVIASAIGFNIQSIAENFARGFVGISKEVEDQYKRLETVSTQATDAAIANNRARLTDEQRYRLALVEREQIEKRINDNNGASLPQILKLKEDELALEQKISEIRSMEDKREEGRNRRLEDYLRNRERVAEAQRSAGLDELYTSQKIAVVKQEIADLEKIIASGVLSENNASELGNKLADRKIELLSLEKQLSDDLAKAVSDALSNHKDTVSALENQEKITKRLVEEEENRRRIAEGNARAAEMTADAYSTGVGALTQSRYGAREIQDASPGALEEILRRDRAQLQLLNLNPGGPFDIDKSYPILQLQNEIAKISEELNLRKDVAAKVERYGVEGARRYFDGNPLVFDRLVQEFTGQREKIDRTNDLLTRLNEKIDRGLTVRAVRTPSADSAVI